MSESTRWQALIGGTWVDVAAVRVLVTSLGGHTIDYQVVYVTDDEDGGREASGHGRGGMSEFIDLTHREALLLGVVRWDDPHRGPVRIRSNVLNEVVRQEARTRRLILSAIARGELRDVFGQRDAAEDENEASPVNAGDASNGI